MGRNPAPLPQEWYARDPKRVALELLGKILVRKTPDNVTIKCMITETEAYYGPEDPASRARKGGDLREVMGGPVGHALVYGVHKQWLLNVVAHKPGEYGAVLFRSCEPLEGLELMMRNRGVDNVKLLTTGPGRLTRALLIDKSFHKKPMYVVSHGLWIEDEGFDVRESDIVSSHRIGVREDLPEKLRFILKTSPYISKPPRG